MVLLTITIWDLWKAIVAIWGLRMVLRCLVWGVSRAGSDWRIAAWRCQGEFLGFLGGALLSAAILQLALLPGPAPDRLLPLALALVGVRALLDLPALLDTCRRTIVEPIRSDLRWRRFLLRLWRRKLAQDGLLHALATAPRTLFARHTERG